MLKLQSPIQTPQLRSTSTIPKTFQEPSISIQIQTPTPIPPSIAKSPGNSTSPIPRPAPQAPSPSPIFCQWNHDQEVESSQDQGIPTVQAKSQVFQSHPSTIRPSTPKTGIFSRRHNLNLVSDQEEENSQLLKLAPFDNPHWDRWLPESQPATSKWFCFRKCPCRLGGITGPSEERLSSAWPTANSAYQDGTRAPSPRHDLQSPSTFSGWRGLRAWGDCNTGGLS